MCYRRKCHCCSPTNSISLSRLAPEPDEEVKLVSTRARGKDAWADDDRPWRQRAPLLLLPTHLVVCLCALSGSSYAPPPITTCRAQQALSVRPVGLGLWTSPQQQPRRFRRIVVTACRDWPRCALGHDARGAVAPSRGGAGHLSAELLRCSGVARRRCRRLGRRVAGRSAPGHRPAAQVCRCVWSVCPAHTPCYCHHLVQAQVRERAFLSWPAHCPSTYKGLSPANRTLPSSAQQQGPPHDTHTSPASAVLLLARAGPTYLIYLPVRTLRLPLRATRPPGAQARSRAHQKWGPATAITSTRSRSRRKRSQVGWGARFLGVLLRGGGVTRQSDGSGAGRHACDLAATALAGQAAAAAAAARGPRSHAASPTRPRHIAGEMRAVTPTPTCPTG